MPERVRLIQRGLYADARVGRPDHDRSEATDRFPARAILLELCDDPETGLTNPLHAGEMGNDPKSFTWPPPAPPRQVDGTRQRHRRQDRIMVILALSAGCLLGLDAPAVSPVAPAAQASNTTAPSTTPTPPVVSVTSRHR